MKKITHYVLSENSDVIFAKVQDDSSESIIEINPNNTSAIGLPSITNSALSVGQFDNLNPVDVRTENYQPIVNFIESYRDAFDNLFSNLQ